jgi:hypothetical protein
MQKTWNSVIHHRQGPLESTVRLVRSVRKIFALERNTLTGGFAQNFGQI